MTIFKGGGGNAGIIEPPTPILSWSGYSSGIFTLALQNFSNMYSYELSSTTGTATISNSGVITISGASNTVDFNTNIKIKSIKGGFVSSPKYMYHKKYSYTPDTRYSYPCGSYYVCGSCSYVPSNGYPCGPGTCPGGYGCDNPSWCSSCQCTSYTRYCSGGSAPYLITESGYNNYGNGWYQI